MGELAGEKRAPAFVSSCPGVAGVPLALLFARARKNERRRKRKREDEGGKGQGATVRP